MALGPLSVEWLGALGKDIQEFVVTEDPIALLAGELADDAQFLQPHQRVVDRGFG